MKRPESETKFFECSCSSEILSVETFDEEPEIYVSIWYRGVRKPMGWKDKFRYCWRIIMHGFPYEDQVVLDKDTAIEMADHIYKVSHK